MTNPKKQRKSSTFNISSKANIDDKLSFTALHLQYLFEHGVNFRDRIINISGEIAYPMWDFFDAALSEMEAQSKEKVTIRIHSGGGDTYEALAIIGRMHNTTVSKIITEGYGHIMSAATLILAAGEERRLSSYAQFMYHEAAYNVGGRHAQNKAIVQQVEVEEKLWARWMAEFSDKSVNFWEKCGVHVDAYITPEQLLDYGVIDKII